MCPESTSHTDDDGPARTRHDPPGQLSEAIVQSSPIPIYSFDLDGIVQTWNPAAERLFGWSADEVIGQLLPIVQQDQIPAFNALRSRIIEDGAVTNVEVTRYRKDGTAFDGLLTAALLQDSDGHSTGILAFMNDVTNEKTALRELKSSEARYRSLFENEHTVMLIIDPETGLIVDANPAAIHFYGWTRQELVGMHLSRINTMPPENIDPVMQKARGNPRNYFEFQHRLKNGEQREVEVFSGPIQQEGRELLYASVHDVTGRRKAEAQLKLQSAALNAAANSIVITYADGRIAWANESFFKNTGYTAADAAGHTPGELIKSGKHDATFYEHMWATLSRGSVWSGEVVNKMRDGRLLTEELTITPMLDEQGAISHFVGVKQDISDRKLLEKQYLRSQRVESIGILAGGIAHDLNNVLAPILMAVDVLKEGEQHAGRLRMLDRMEISARRGAELVKQVLAFSRGSDSDPVILNVRHVAKELETIIFDTFPKNIVFKLQYERDLWLTLADPTLIHQVLMNLAVNARDAMPDGGSLTIRLSNERVQETYTRSDSTFHSGNYVEVEVSDTGTGIPDDHLERIFDPFFTTKEPGKGTGLGLATVQTIVENHKGFLTVDSRHGEGTTFRVFLPAVQADAADTNPHVADSSSSNELRSGHNNGNGKCILVADDEDAIRTVVSITLEQAGYRVVTAPNGAEALEHFQANPDAIDLVILDGAMPVMDGKATLRAIRAMHPEARVVLSSGYIDAEHEAAYHQAGTTAFLHKPFTVNDLLETVEIALANPPAPRA